MTGCGCGCGRVSALGLAAVLVACGTGAPQAPPPGLQPGATADPLERSGAHEAVPIDPHATEDPLPIPAPPEPPRPRAEELLSSVDAGSPAAADLVEVIAEVKENLLATRYQHKTRVRRRKGYYAWDCSGMVAWMLRRSAPRALRALRKKRPLAIDFYDAIARAPTAKSRRGWQQLDHVSEARPGDLFAFPRSPVSKSPVTGHVGFFIERPWPVPELEGAWAARILDATRTPHQDDTRTDDGIGGFGFGTMMFVNDETGKTIAYGWYGTESGGYMPTHVAYGRVTR